MQIATSDGLDEDYYKNGSMEKNHYHVGMVTLNGMIVGVSYLKRLGQVAVKAIILNIAYFIF